MDSPESVTTQNWRTEERTPDISNPETFQTFASLCNSIIKEKDDATFAIGGRIPLDPQLQSDQDGM